jgi:hypothetical protein
VSPFTTLPKTIADRCQLYTIVSSHETRTIALIVVIGILGIQLKWIATKRCRVCKEYAKRTVMPPGGTQPHENGVGVEYI